MIRLLCFLVFLLGFSACTNSQKETTTVPEIKRVEALNVYFKLIDGPLNFSTVRLLYYELSGDPQGWLEVMAKDSVSFNKFLKSLGPAVFMVEDDCTTVEGLEMGRLQELQILRELVVSPALQPTLKRVIEQMETIRSDTYH